MRDLSEILTAIRDRTKSPGLKASISACLDRLPYTAPELVVTEWRNMDVEIRGFLFREKFRAAGDVRLMPPDVRACLELWADMIKVSDLDARILELSNKVPGLPGSR